MSFRATFDNLTAEDLRATGAMKWSLPAPTIGAFVAEMDFGTSPAVQAALVAAVEKGCFGYTPDPLIREVQDATAERLLRAHEWRVEPSDVHPVPDVITVFEQAMAQTSAGSPVVIPTPSYMNFFNAAATAGRRVVEVPMVLDEAGRHTWDLDALATAIRSSGAELVVLCNPHNPTGRAHTRAELEAFARVITDTGARVFADEIWAPLVHAGHRHLPYASVSEQAAEHSITAISASKGWNIPGLKCAQAVTTNDRDREHWRSMTPPLAHRTSTIGQAATIAAYRDQSDWLCEVTAYLEENTALVHDQVAEAIPGARVTRPEATYVSWIDLRDADAPEDPAAFLLERAGVAVTDGRQCGTVGQGCIRMTTAIPQPILREVLARMTSALRTR